MKISRLAFYVLLILWLPLSTRAAERKITGLWQGSLSFNGMTLRIVFHIDKDSAGSLKGTLDSPDQGAKGIGVDNITLSGDSVRLEIKLIAGGYYGVLLPGDSVISGSWHQGGIALPLELRPILAVAEIRHPQEPKPPYPYAAEEVSYKNDEAGVTLAGTLTKPNGGGPFPALLLITGSGPQNRDEELLGQKPFLVISDYLTRRGIAVLRVDDRGVGKSTGVFGTATTLDFAGDVKAGLNYLKSRSDIDPRKIGLLGHSEGGIIAPMVASQSKDVAFIVLMAGPSLRGDQILYLQDSLISAAMGVPAEQISRELWLNRKLFTLAQTVKDTAELHRELLDAIEEAMSRDSSTGGKVSSVQAEATARQICSPWFRYFLSYDPLPALEHVACPILALDGSKDLQVPAAQNIKGMETAFAVSGNKEAKAMILPGLNHLFQKSETGSPTEYAKIEETVNPGALKVIGDWIEEKVKE